MKSDPRKTFVLLGLAAVTMLAGCGGSGGSGGASQPPATIAVAPDNSTIAWNAPGSIDVLSNDSASRGALTLTAVTGALHGTATVANGKVTYTPNTGFYGVETLSYTATAAEGGASAKADIKVTVEAVLTLNGNASDSPLANASVTAAVGTRTFTTTTGASGDFGVVVRSSAPLEFVTLTAVGSGTQEKVKLVSLVGDIDGLVKGAAQGQVSMSAVPSLSVSHYSSAFAALANKARDGSAPATAVQLRDVTAQISLSEMLQGATAIRLVADKGVLLPAGIADTFALVQSQSAIDAVYAAAKLLNAQLAATTRAGVEAELNAGSAFTLDGLPERTVVYNTGDFTVTYRADGTGRLSGRSGEHDIKWTAEGATVRLTYEKPVEWIYGPFVLRVAGAYSPYSIREYSQGMIIRLVMGESVAKWGESGTVTWIDGPNAGMPVVVDVTTTNIPKYLTGVLAVDRRLPITAAMTAPGAMLFGVPNMPVPALESDEESGSVRVDVPRTATDILEFTSATGAVFSGSKEAVTWKVQENWLHVTHANGKVWRYALVTQNDATAKQLWLAEFEALKIKKTFVGFTAPAPKMAYTLELAMRAWNSSSAVRLNGTPLADGTVANSDYPSDVYNSKWEITAAGDLVLTFSLKSSAELLRTVRYVPIKFIGEQLWVIAYDYNAARPLDATSTLGYIEKRP